MRNTDLAGAIDSEGAKLYNLVMGKSGDGQKVIPTGRFAPTPSGEMHLGNLLCALLAYLSVKSKGGRFLIRIEDLDTVRCPHSAGERLIDALCRFGLTSDAPPIFQSERTDAYIAKLAVLERQVLIYPCYCSRAELHAAEAPRLSDGGIVYAGTCRALTKEEREAKAKTRKPCLRVAVPDADITFTDGLKGEYTQNLARECGDFIVRRSDGVFAYQLAVVVDDGDSGVTEVLRGDDLISSAPRQIYLARLLGYAPPNYIHIPIVTDAAGRKLSKTDGDRIAQNLAVLPPERILGALGYAAGIIDTDRAAALPELVSLYRVDKIKREIRLPATVL